MRLLRALIADVDEPALRRVPTGEAAERGPEHAEASGAVQASGQASGPEGSATPSSRRRGPRTIVALGVAGVVLASTGVAAAGSGVTEPAAPAPQAAETGRGESADRTRPERASRARTRQGPDVRPVGVPAPPVRQVGERRDRAPETRAAAEPDPLRDRLEDLRDELEGLLPPQTPRAEPRQPFTWPSPPGGHRDDRGDRAERDGRGERGDRDPGDQTRRRLDDIRRRTEKRLDRYR
ncbi:hypothetical protein ACFVH6_43555 [Spirillospora sp. NPDC127200]